MSSTAVLCSAASLSSRSMIARLRGHVERGGRFVADEHGGPGRHRDGDHDPLPHAARELVRVLIDPDLRLVHPDLGEQLDRAQPCLALAESLVDAQGLGDLLAHGVHGVQRRHRVLVDHADIATPHVAPSRARGRGEQVAAVEQDLALELGAVGEAHDRQAR